MYEIAKTGGSGDGLLLLIVVLACGAIWHYLYRGMPKMDGHDERLNKLEEGQKRNNAKWLAREQQDKTSIEVRHDTHIKNEGEISSQKIANELNESGD